MSFISLQFSGTFVILIVLLSLAIDITERKGISSDFFLKYRKIDISLYLLISICVLDCMC